MKTTMFLPLFWIAQVGTVMPVLAQQAPLAQQAAAQKEEPKTKLEQFQAKTGAVIIMGYSTVGSISAQFGGSVRVETREITDAASGSKQFGVYIAVKEGGRFERENSSYIDLDEIESLVKGIEYISGLTAEVTKLGGFQAEYRTRGDLAVLTYSSAKEIQAAVKSSRYGAATGYLTRNDLARFREFLRTAQARLQSLKGS